MSPGQPARRRWLVTGAHGQLGRSLAAIAPGTGVDLVGLDRDELDVADAEAVSEAVARFAPDVVVNAAAFTAVDRCESEPEAAERTNAAGAGAVARACAGRALLIHLSTDYVFAGRDEKELAEDDPTEPLSAYGRSKLRGEGAVREAAGEHLIVRTSWLFGPGPNFVRAILARAAAGESLRVVEDEVGRPTWSGSLARALLQVPDAPVRGTLHLANEGVASRHAFACEIVREAVRRGLAPEVPVHPIRRADLGRPAARPAHAVLALARARAAGFALGHWKAALVAYLDAEGDGRDA